MAAVEHRRIRLRDDLGELDARRQFDQIEAGTGDVEHGQPGGRGRRGGANSCGETPSSAVTSFAAVVTGWVAAVDTVGELVVDRTASATTGAHVVSVGDRCRTEGRHRARNVLGGNDVSGCCGCRAVSATYNSLGEVTRDVCDVDVARAAAAGTAESGSYPSAAGSAAERVSATETVPAMGAR
ncbi:MAG TPA: hypothetical protein VFK56_17665 [Mycobacterium sp.]|nr:hypothetical protein [Mycobacterium sp.]